MRKYSAFSLTIKNFSPEVNLICSGVEYYLRGLIISKLVSYSMQDLFYYISCLLKEFGYGLHEIEVSTTILYHQ